MSRWKVRAVQAIKGCSCVQESKYLGKAILNGEGDHFRTPILDHFRTPMSWIIFEHRVGQFRTHGGAILRHPWGWGGGWGGAVTFASYCVTVPLRPGAGGGGGVGQLRSPLTA